MPSPRFAALLRFERGSVEWFYRLFGLSMVANVATEMRIGIWDVHAGRLFPFRHPPLVPLYGTSLLALEWIATAASGLALVLGFHPSWASRTAAFSLFVGLSQRFSNHGSLLALVALFLALDPPNTKETGFDTKSRPYFALIRLQLAIVYLFAGLQKLGHGFQGGAPLAVLFGISPVWSVSISWSVVAVQLALPFVLMWAPRLGLASVFALHIAFAYALPNLWSFGLTMASMAVLFVGRPRFGIQSE